MEKSANRGLDVFLTAPPRNSGCHLYLFNVFGQQIGDAKSDFGFGKEIASDSKKLQSIKFRPGDKFSYLYDFGDDWLHEKVVEKITDPEKDQQYPVCLKGKRSCPPEEVGGIWGYKGFLEAIADPNHPEHEAMSEWYDDELDLEFINNRLGRSFKRL